MSLEAKIEELNGNIVKLIDVMSKGGTATGGKTDKGADKGADEGKRGPGRPAGSKGASSKDDKGAKAKAPSEDDLRQVFGDFMRVDDEDEREARKSYVKGVLKQYGVAKATEIAEGDRAEAIEVIKEEQAKREAKAGDGEDDDLV